MAALSAAAPIPSGFSPIFKKKQDGEDESRKFYRQVGNLHTVKGVKRLINNGVYRQN